MLHNTSIDIYWTESKVIRSQLRYNADIQGVPLVSVQKNFNSFLCQGSQLQTQLSQRCFYIILDFLGSNES